ncbi:hypothetical protein ABZZ16_36735, partial [Streptomyces sp. NPDC006386]|uniref:hypothetical protein n=1 Tax=Streptomyces sp. NPDC006386 TaxID=3156762 RepID=UPI0033ADD369
MRPRTASVPRITSLPPLALACGALVVGAGGLYLAGLVLTGGEIDSGTTVRGVREYACPQGRKAHRGRRPA